MAVATLIVIGVSSILMVGATVYSVRASQKMTDRSISEGKKSRELSAKSLEFSKESLEASRKQHSTNVVIGIIGILVSLATIGFAVWQWSKSRGV